MIMGGTYLFEFLSWYYDNANNAKPWLVVILEIFGALSPIPVFLILCFNKRTLDQLRDEHPLIHKIMKALEPRNCFANAKAKDVGSQSTGVVTSSAGGKDSKS